MRYVPCSQCKIPLKSYFLKNGVCGGCRNPHLIVEAVVASKSTECKCCGIDLTSDKSDYCECCNENDECYNNIED